MADLNADDLNWPVSYEAEQQVIGAVLANNRAYDRCSLIVTEEDFADFRHATLWRVLGEMINAGEVADPVTVHARTRDDKTIEEVGGAKYLAGLVRTFVNVAAAPDYAQTVADLAGRRRVMQEALDLLSAMQDTGTASKESLDRGLETIEAVRDGVRGNAAMTLIGDAAMRAIQMADDARKAGAKVLGVPSGFVDLDKRVGGFEPGQLYIIAGRPGMGKTALALNIANHIADWTRTNKLPWDPERVRAPVLFASLEMPDTALALRVLSQRTNYESMAIRTGNIPTDAFTTLLAAAADLKHLPLVVDETPAQTLQGVKARARLLARKMGIAGIVVDHLGLMAASREARRHGPTAEITEITAGLKQLAKEMRCPVLALCQLNRNVEHREDKRPTLSDLRQSGSIEQDADAVLFVYREAYYLERAEPEKREGESDAAHSARHVNWSVRLAEKRAIADIIIAKQRNGPMCEVRLHYESTLARFSNWGGTGEDAA